MRRIDPEGWTLVGFLMLAWALKPLAHRGDVGCRWGGRGVRPSDFLWGLLGYQFAVVSGWMGPMWSMPIGNAVLAGIAGLLAGVLHAPLTAILLAAEVRAVTPCSCRSC